MTATDPGVLDLAVFVDELAQWYALGELGEAAGISGSAELRQQSAELLADTAERLGVGVDSLPESAGAMSGAARKAWTWLSKQASSVVGKAAASQGLILTIGGIWVGHDWLSSFERVKLERVRTEGELVRSAWNAVPAGERGELVRSYLASTGSGPSVGTLVTLGVLGVLGLFGWRYWVAR